MFNNKTRQKTRNCCISMTFVCTKLVIGLRADLSLDCHAAWIDLADQVVENFSL